MHFQPSETLTAEDGSTLGVTLYDGEVLIPFSGVVERVQSLKDIKLRDDDILVAAYPKSGLNWVCNLISMITHRDQFMANRNVDIPERYFLDAQDESAFAQAPSPRLLTTHFSPRFLPESLSLHGKGKMVYVTRNPKDVIVSMYYFLHPDKYYCGSFGALFEFFMSGKLPCGNWFEYIDAYNKFNGEMKDRVCVIMYEDLKMDPHTHINRIAKHLGVELTKDEVNLFIDVSSVTKMKERYRHKNNLRSKILFELYRKGFIGDWKTHFTVAMNEKFDAEYKCRMKDINLVYQFE